MKKTFKELLFKRDNTKMDNALASLQEIGQYCKLFGITAQTQEGFDECIKQFCQGKYEEGILAYLRVCIRAAEAREWK